MKKFGILAAALFTSVAVMAQESVVKVVERQLKAAKPDNTAALKAIQPALTNAETANQMMPWYLAGKAAMGVYDDTYLQYQMGNQLSPAQQQAAGQALLDSYNYYVKAMHLDSLPNEKGKIKPKKAKGMIDKLSGHYSDYLNAGLWLYNAQQYPAAYEAWNIYTTMPENALLGDKKPTAQPDSIVGQICFYQGNAALITKDAKAAMKSYARAMDKGYNDIQVYTYGAEAAREAGDTIAMLDMLHKGYDKFGTQDVNLIGQLINYELDHNNLDNAMKLVNDAIAKSDNSKPDMLSQLYYIRGFIAEQNKDLAAARADFEKCVQVDPNNASGYWGLGRLKYNAAFEKSQQITTAIPQEVKDEFLLAIQDLKKSYELDPKQANIPSVIFQAYYILGNGYEEDAKYWQGVAGISY